VSTLAPPTTSLPLLRRATLQRLVVASFVRRRTSRRTLHESRNSTSSYVHANISRPVVADLWKLLRGLLAGMLTRPDILRPRPRPEIQGRGQGQDQRARGRGRDRGQRFEAKAKTEAKQPEAKAEAEASRIWPRDRGQASRPNIPGSWVVFRRCYHVPLCTVRNIFSRRKRYDSFNNYDMFMRI